MQREPSDGEMLGRFIAKRDEAAFAFLVQRHGPMVLAACRRVSVDVADADDAFQATFLTLAAKAMQLSRRGCLAGWLHEVARHVALRLRESAQARKRREHAVAEMAEDASDVTVTSDLAEHLDAALASLPDRYRLPLIMHHGQNRSCEDVARVLSLRPNTIAVRLGRGRELLRSRLLQRGIVVPALTAVTALAQVASADDVSGFTAVIARSAAAMASGSAVAIPSQVIAASRATLKAMYVAQVKAAAFAASAAAIIFAGLLFSLHVFGTEGALPVMSVGEDKSSDVTAADEAWVQEATSGWFPGHQIPTRTAFPFGMWLSRNSLGAGNHLSIARIGGCAEPWDFRSEARADSKPVFSAIPLHESERLAALAAGKGWTGPREGQPTILVLGNEALYADQVWSPYSLARDGAIITCIVDCWTDEKARLRSAVVSRAMLVDLGDLPAGDYTVRFLQRTFHQGDDGHYHPRAFDYTSVPVHVANATAGASAEPVEISQLRTAGQEGGGWAWFSRGSRQVPHCMSLNLTPSAGRHPYQSSFTVGRFQLSKWLDSHPSSTADLPTPLPADATEGERYAFVVGPALGKDEQMSLCDAFWLTMPDTPRALVVRLDIWSDRLANRSEPFVPVLVIALPDDAGPLTQLSPHWTIFSKQSNGHYESTTNFTNGAFVSGGTPWQAVELLFMREQVHRETK
jgi:RNA polymerase sigma factor (sigma-70 family)